MATPILATKLYIPLPRPQLVARPRLIERLNAGIDAGHKLALIAAPAGFGKTTLLSAWAAQKRLPIAWLSLEDNDNDVARFLTYLVAALQTVAPGVGADALNLLQARQSLPAERILTTLINDIARMSHAAVLVLDDYHVIEAQPIHAALTFLLDHLPRPLQLIIASRSDPLLPLARLRARAELTELRASDLRFTPDEATHFLNHGMGLALAAEDIAALEARTEGWIAGLQMAALSMHGRDDAAAFVHTFTGSHRYVIDYLVEEVLQRQPESVRRFLLRTAILDRLNGPLCEAVSGEADGAAMLQRLERANLFVVPLDDRREWYRYHHLFADVLRARLNEARLTEAQPDEIAALHRRASAWYEQHALPAEAIRHALSAGDAERAADLIELAWPIIRRDRQDATLRGWLLALPDAVVRRRPLLSTCYVWVLIVAGELEAAERRLQDAEQGLAALTDGAMASDMPRPVVANVDEFRNLPVIIEVYRAGLAQAYGDVAGTARHAQRALDRVQAGEHLGRGAAAGLLGLALLASGDLAAAQRTFADASVSLKLAGNVADAISTAVVLYEMCVAQGHLHEARRLLEQSWQFALAQGEPVPLATGDLLVAFAELHHEQNALAEAEDALARSKALGERASLPENWYRWHVAMARVRAARGDMTDALERLEAAERLYLPGFMPDVRPIAALRARLWIAQGRLAEAWAWAQARRLSAADDVDYLREYEHLSLARLHIAQWRATQTGSVLDDGLCLLSRLLAAAEAAGRLGSVNEILVLQAMAHAARGDVAPALAALQRALAQAWPEGYVRLFVGEGAPMAALLQEAVQRGIAPDQARRLLSALGRPVSEPPAAQNLADPLSARERDVLRLLRTDLSGPDIARQLMVSLNTFQTHTRNIYSKLGVSSRKAAVRQAEALGLF